MVIINPKAVINILSIYYCNGRRFLYFVFFGFFMDYAVFPSGGYSIEDILGKYRFTVNVHNPDKFGQFLGFLHQDFPEECRCTSMNYINRLVERCVSEQINPVLRYNHNSSPSDSRCRVFKLDRSLLVYDDFLSDEFGAPKKENDLGFGFISAVIAGLALQSLPKEYCLGVSGLVGIGVYLWSRWEYVDHKCQCFKDKFNPDFLSAYLGSGNEQEIGRSKALLDLFPEILHTRRGLSARFMVEKGQLKRCVSNVEDFVFDKLSLIDPVI